jgi:Tyrosine phosphatase family
MNITSLMRRTCCITLLILLVFSVTPTSVLGQPQGPRWLGLEGAANSRDAGGYKNHNEQTVRRGLLLRSNALGGLSEVGCAQFTALKVKTVVDFRMTWQVDALPDPACVMDTTSYNHHPIDIIGATWEEVYTNIVNLYAESIVKTFDLLADPQNLPLLVHCVAGKDRTGIFVALVHKLLGVSDQDIMADFLLSLEVNYHVSPGWLQTILALIEQEGGIETFLGNRSVSPGTQNAVRKNLLTTPSNVIHWSLYD